MSSVLKRGVNGRLDFGVTCSSVSSASNFKELNGDKLSHLNGSL